MWQLIFSFLGGPFISGLLKAYQAHLEQQGKLETLDHDLAARELTVQQRELEVQSQLKIAEIGHWYEPEHLFAYITLAFYSKCLVWDKMLAWGHTDHLDGDVSVWAGLIMSFYFGKRGIENVARILKR